MIAPTPLASIAYAVIAGSIVAIVSAATSAAFCYLMTHSREQRKDHELVIRIQEQLISVSRAVEELKRRP